MPSFCRKHDTSSVPSGKHLAPRAFQLNPLDWPPCCLTSTQSRICVVNWRSLFKPSSCHLDLWLLYSRGSWIRGLQVPPSCFQHLIECLLQFLTLLLCTKGIPHIIRWVYIIICVFSLYTVLAMEIASHMKYTNDQFNRCTK